MAPSRRAFGLRLATIALAVSAQLVTASAAVAQGVAPSTRPNIVFVLSDDHAAHAISAYRAHLGYGARLPDTPRLDRLAADGMLFTNAFVTNSICGPSRATVLTGQYGHLTGVMTNRQALHPTAVTFPALLQDAGYRTALFGKWHLGTAPEGFDYYEVLRGQGPYYNSALRSATDTVEYIGYTPDILARRAIEWMSREGAGERPFLLMLQFNAPHRYWDPGPDQLGLYRDTVIPEPATFFDDGSGRASGFLMQEMMIALDLFERDLKLEPPANLTPQQLARWRDAYAVENAAAASLEGEALTRWKYQRYIKDYLRAAAAVDTNVGRVLDFLRDAGLDSSTVVVYTADQGFFLGDHGFFDKRWMYEESLRTPLIVRWPGRMDAGAVNDELVMNLDFAPTLLDLGGATVPAAMQGRSLVPLLSGRAPDDWRDAIYYQYFEYPGWHMVQRHYGVRTHRYKLIHYYELGEWELFDLARDPNELNSVYENPSYADVVRDLEARLRKLRDQYDVPASDPVPHAPFDPPADLRRPHPPSAHAN